MSDHGWIQTRSGRKFNFLAMAPEDVVIEDIAHALSNLCRFGGHCKRFYSVAEHSLLVSRILPPEYALTGLLHDATEAYVVDLPRPLKQLIGEAYTDIEGAVWEVIARRYDLPIVLPPAIKEADNAVLLAEKAQLMDDPPVEWQWAKGLKPAAVAVWGVEPRVAANNFLIRFHELTAR